MKNRTIRLAVLFLLYGHITYAQQNIGIGTAAPHASAKLDVSDANKGMLIPRVNLVFETDGITIANPAVSLLVYNTNPAMPFGEGFYYWSGAKWQKIITDNNLLNLTWNTSGNAGTSPVMNFIGTTDNVPLVFKVNNVLSGKIETSLSNSFWGYQAGMANTTGNRNSFFGDGAGKATTTGYQNSFFRLLFRIKQYFWLKQFWFWIWDIIL